MNSNFSFQRFLKTALAIAIVATFAGQASAQSGARNSSQGSASQKSASQGSASQGSTSQGSQTKTTQTTQQQTPLQQFQQIAANSQTELGLEGYCPVCVIKFSKWVIGDANFPAAYDGKTYFFPSEQVRQTFVDNPAAYTPALGGDCTVCYEKAGKRGAGNIRFSSLHNDRLFLFPSKKEMDVFNNSATEYENTDLAANGECIVCKVKAGKSVAGNAQFTAVHDGFRYQFPSDRERQEFLKQPQLYVASVAKKMMQEGTFTNGESAMEKKEMMFKESMGSGMKKEAMPKGDSMGSGTKEKAMMKETSMIKGGEQPTFVSADLVQISGTTGCAACEYGVSPIGAPKELGLAVKSSEGKVYVIEDGHSRWPELYKARFNGQQVAVSGTVIKTEGNVAWIQPADLNAL